MKLQLKKTYVPYLAALLALPCLTFSADKGKPAPTINAPDTTVCSSNAVERTLPFPVGDKALYFLNLRDGDKVRSPFRVAFSVSGMGVSPVQAGNIEGTGHHHILIDLDLPQDIKNPIPFDSAEEYQRQHYKHFGKGETETVLNLPPGKHKLRLMFANHQHVPYYIASKEVNIEVLASKG